MWTWDPLSWRLDFWIGPCFAVVGVSASSQSQLSDVITATVLCSCGGVPAVICHFHIHCRASWLNRHGSRPMNDGGFVGSAMLNIGPRNLGRPGVACVDGHDEVASSHAAERSAYTIDSVGT
jgi:hypothetical protein